jgi:DnaJ family protein A protein 5
MFNHKKNFSQFHPDKNPDDPEGAKQLFQVIQQAYEDLSDPQVRYGIPTACTAKY